MARDTNEGKVAGRAFLVGCPRSGTTLLQSMIAAHPEFTSFPESHFFTVLRARPWLAKLGVASRRAHRRLAAFVKELGRENLDNTRLPPITERGATRAFVRTLDNLAVERGKSRWLEKTPDHVFFVDDIERHVAGARFVHIIRDGRDVVASLYDATKRFPRDWGGPWDIDRCVDKWNSAVGATAARARASHDLTVVYEDLVADPKRVLMSVSRYLGVEFHPHMISGAADSTADLILEFETWKTESNGGGFPRTTKYRTLFDADQRVYIEANLARFPDLYTS